MNTFLTERILELSGIPLNESQLIDTGKKVFDSGKVYFQPDISKESFIHFTSENNVKKIIGNKRLRRNKDSLFESHFAVSTLYGDFIEVVQNPKVFKRDFIGETQAILFKTKQLPERGYIEEVSFGDRIVYLTDVKRITLEEAMNLIKKSPIKISEDDVVIYKKELVEKF
jgi:hypothetical protein